MIIGLGYKARVGKDTLGSYLVKQHNYKSISFAYSIKEAAKIIFGWNDDHVYGHLKELIDPFWHKSPRDMLQKLGTEACRNNIRQDIWVKSVEKKITDDPTSDWVITDCRFENEIMFVKGFGGIVIRLDRNVTDEISPGATEHSSETALDEFTGWDYIIKNNDSFDNLYNQMEDILKDIKELTE